MDSSIIFIETTVLLLSALCNIENLHIITAKWSALILSPLWFQEKHFLSIFNMIRGGLKSCTFAQSEYGSAHPECV